MDQRNSQYKVEVDGHYETTLDWRNMTVELIDSDGDQMLFRYDNHHYRAELVDLNLQDKTLSLRLNGELHHIDIKDNIDLVIEKMGLSSVETSISNELKSPMPGQVKEVLVEQGQTVEEGDPLLVLVAMKMENILKSPTSGLIADVLVKAEDIVNKNDVLVSFDKG